MSDPAAEALLRDLDVRFQEAVMARDIPTLDALLADDYRYTHQNGRQQTKWEYIDGIAHVDSTARRVLSDLACEIHDDVAVTRANLDLVRGDGREHTRLRYVRVHRREGASWRAFSHHACPATDRALSG